MMQYLLNRYGLVVLLLVGCDGIWLFSMMPVYQRELAPILAADFRVPPIVCFYLLYAAAVLMLAVTPSRTRGEALWRGLLLGAAAYGTYDLTNRGTVEHFSLFLCCLDLAWGTLLTGLVAFFGWRPAPQHG